MTAADPPADDILACQRCGARTTRTEASLRKFRNGLSACCGDLLVTTEGPRRIVVPLGDAKAALDAEAERLAKIRKRHPERMASLLWDSSKGPYVAKKHGPLRPRRRRRP